MSVKLFIQFLELYSFFLYVPTLMLLLFSGLTEGLYEVKEVRGQEATAAWKWSFLKSLKKNYIVKKIHLSPACFLVRWIKVALINVIESGEQRVAQVELPCQTYDQTTLEKLHKGDKFSISLQSENPEHYLLQDAPIHRAVLTDTRLAEGHQYTLELTFEVYSDQEDLTAQSQWIGLNGSSLTVREFEKVGNKLIFKIHVGRQTRELTIFGKAENGHKVNLTPGPAKQVL